MRLVSSCDTCYNVCLQVPIADHVMFVSELIFCLAINEGCMQKV